jgi:hypothetical protein
MKCHSYSAGARFDSEAAPHHNARAAYDVKIRIVRQPVGDVNGVTVSHYLPGHSYDVAPRLASYLVSEGFAFFERRDVDKQKAPPKLDRRKKP